MERPFNDPSDPLPLLLIDTTPPAQIVGSRPAGPTKVGALVEACARRPHVVLATAAPLVAAIAVAARLVADELNGVVDGVGRWEYVGFQSMLMTPTFLVPVAAVLAGMRRTVGRTPTLDAAEQRAHVLVAVVECALVALGAFAFVAGLARDDERLGVRLDTEARVLLASVIALHVLGAAIAIGGLRWAGPAPLAEGPEVAPGPPPPSLAPNPGDPPSWWNAG